MVEHDEICGLGEMAPVGYGDPQTAEGAEIALRAVEEVLLDFDPSRISAIEEQMLNRGVPSAARAAVNTACWDWLAKRAGLPLYRLLGLERETVPTSITIGICAPEEARAQAEQIAAESPECCIKIKLGSSDGVESDKQRYLAVHDGAPHAKLRVDANGGWNSLQALSMMGWLENRGCEYVEQPVHHDDEDGIRCVAESRKLPLYLDENIHTSKDLPRWANYCDGVNLKLMKTGGVSEALRLVATARAIGLSTMIGCMSESSVGIGAGAHIASLFDHVDLDSHLNLNPDPADGLGFSNGRVLPADRVGLGVSLK